MMIIVVSETKVIIPYKMLHKVGMCPTKTEMETIICKEVSKLFSSSKIVGYCSLITQKFVIHL